MRTPISKIVFTGDSMTDRGKMNQRRLLNQIPMSVLSGLAGQSPLGRFTNGYACSDYFIQSFAESIDLKVTDHDLMASPDRVSTQEGIIVARTYCEGGATAHNYGYRDTLDPTLIGKQTILASLDALRDRQLDDESAMGIDDNERAQTLNIIWIGANDLVTVNTEPTMNAAERAALAIEFHIRQLILNGHSHFAVMGLPDLSKTPRYLLKTESEQRIMQEIANYFNRRLSEIIDHYSVRYLYKTFLFYSPEPFFNTVFSNPAQFDLKAELKTTPLIELPEFKNGDKICANAGASSWDGLHCTTALHKRLSTELSDTLQQKYYFQASSDTLICTYRKQYGLKFSADKNKFGGFFRKSKIDYMNRLLSLEDIISHALSNKNNRTHDIIMGLGWVDKMGNALSHNPNIVEAIRNIKAKQAAVASAGMSA
jgi:phospholipase/lecithinase/hemolysin